MAEPSVRTLAHFRPYPATCAQRPLLYNDYMRAAINVRMIVETLDASGQVTDTTFA
jgi:hypothetical protein